VRGTPAESTNQEGLSGGGPGGRSGLLGDSFRRSSLYVVLGAACGGRSPTAPYSAGRKKSSCRVNIT
jgi:hypothetical protein